jgi:hypothetical protein
MFAHHVYKLKDISDGTTMTYLLGEKFVEPSRYIDPGSAGGGLGDDQGALVSDDRDTLRYSNNVFIPSPDKQLLPTDDANNYTYRFGGPHSSGFLMAFCDGSVRAVSFSIDTLISSYLANRKDGQTFDRSGVF